MVGLKEFMFISLSKPTIYSAWNVGIHFFLGWAGLECLILGINSIIWNHNTVNWASLAVWCDISKFSSFALSNDGFHRWTM
jgi:pheromone a factor receptor